MFGAYPYRGVPSRTSLLGVYKSVDVKSRNVGFHPSYRFFYSNYQVVVTSHFFLGNAC